jgi:hypothetical protein
VALSLRFIIPIKKMNYSCHYAGLANTHATRVLPKKPSKSYVALQDNPTVHGIRGFAAKEHSMSSIAYEAGPGRAEISASSLPRQRILARIWARFLASRQQQALDHIRRFGVVDASDVQQRMASAAKGDSRRAVR